MDNVQNVTVSVDKVIVNNSPLVGNFAIWIEAASIFDNQHFDKLGIPQTFPARKTFIVHDLRIKANGKSLFCKTPITHDFPDWPNTKKFGISIITSYDTNMNKETYGDLQCYVFVNAKSNN